jgi:hypothetical protein
MTGLGSEMPWLPADADETFDPLAHADVDKHLTENVEGTKQVTRSRLLTLIAVTRDIEVETPALSPEQFENEEETYGDQLEYFYELTAALNEEVAAARSETDLNEAAIRRIVRDELQHAKTDGGS